MCCREYNKKEIEDLIQNCENVIECEKLILTFLTLELHFYNSALNLGFVVIS